MRQPTVLSSPAGKPANQHHCAAPGTPIEFHGLRHLVLHRALGDKLCIISGETHQQTLDLTLSQMQLVTPVASGTCSQYFANMAPRWIG